MYCQKCGQEVGDYTRICPSCGELLDTTQSSTPSPQPEPYASPSAPMLPIPDYKVQSILLIVFSVVFCCFTYISIIALPFAIVALLNSNKIAVHKMAGNYDLAQGASKKAKMWCWISFGIIMVSIILGIILLVSFMNSGAYQEFLNQYMDILENYQSQ